MVTEADVTIYGYGIKSVTLLRELRNFMWITVMKS